MNIDSVSDIENGTNVCDELRNFIYSTHLSMTCPTTSLDTIVTLPHDTTGNSCLSCHFSSAQH